MVISSLKDMKSCSRFSFFRLNFYSPHYIWIFSEAPTHIQHHWALIEALFVSIVFSSGHGL